MEGTPVHTLNFTGVLSVSKRIIKVNYGHFLALSLFFLPISFSFIIHPALRLSGHFFTVDHFHQFPPNQQKVLIAHALYILIAYILSLCAIATVTYSSYQVFLGTSPNFLTALKSLASSFFPILSTSIVAHLLLFLISFTFLMFVGLIVMLGQTLGFVIDYHSIYFTWFSAVVGVTLFVILINFYVNWSLAFVIVVAESKWGFAPLMRSSYLVKGMRSVSLLVFLYFGVFSGLLVWVYTNSLYLNSWNNWALVLFTMLGLFFLMMILTRSTAANTVLYMYCKALHGELAIDIAEGFAYGYIHLPQDDEKVSLPHVVTVVTA